MNFADIGIAGRAYPYIGSAIVKVVWVLCTMYQAGLILYQLLVVVFIACIVLYRLVHHFYGPATALMPVPGDVDHGERLASIHILDHV